MRRSNRLRHRSDRFIRKWWCFHGWISNPGVDKDYRRSTRNKANHHTSKEKFALMHFRCAKWRFSEQNEPPSPAKQWHWRVVKILGIPTNKTIVVSSVLTTTFAFKSLYHFSRTLSILWVSWWRRSVKLLSTTMTSVAAMLVAAAREDHRICCGLKSKSKPLIEIQRKQKMSILTIISNNKKWQKDNNALNFETKGTWQYACVHSKMRIKTWRIAVTKRMDELGTSRWSILWIICGGSLEISCLERSIQKMTQSRLPMIGAEMCTCFGNIRLQFDTIWHAVRMTSFLIIFAPKITLPLSAKYHLKRIFLLSGSLFLIRNFKG